MDGENRDLHCDSGGAYGSDRFYDCGQIDLPVWGSDAGKRQEAHRIHSDWHSPEFSACDCSGSGGDDDTGSVEREADPPGPYRPPFPGRPGWRACLFHPRHDRSEGKFNPVCRELKMGDQNLNGGQKAQFRPRGVLLLLKVNILNFVTGLLVVIGKTEDGVLRSEEHTSELQSRGHLVCRLLLEKTKTKDET